jgi:hypothetical protein
LCSVLQLCNIKELHLLPFWQISDLGQNCGLFNRRLRDKNKKFDNIDTRVLKSALEHQTNSDRHRATLCPTCSQCHKTILSLTDVLGKSACVCPWQSYTASSNVSRLGQQHTSGGPKGFFTWVGCGLNSKL